jgi:hypothetical protein
MKRHKKGSEVWFVNKQVFGDIYMGRGIYEGAATGRTWVAPMAYIKIESDNKYHPHIYFREFIFDTFEEAQIALAEIKLGGKCPPSFIN